MNEAAKDITIKVLDSVHDYKAEEEPVPQVLSDIIITKYLQKVGEPVIPPLSLKINK